MPPPMVDCREMLRFRFEERGHHRTDTPTHPPTHTHLHTHTLTHQPTNQPKKKVNIHNGTSDNKDENPVKRDKEKPKKKSKNGISLPGKHTRFVSDWRCRGRGNPVRLDGYYGSFFSSPNENQELRKKNRASVLDTVKSSAARNEDTPPCANNNGEQGAAAGSTGNSDEKITTAITIKTRRNCVNPMRVGEKKPLTVWPANGSW